MLVWDLSLKCDRAQVSPSLRLLPPTRRFLDHPPQKQCVLRFFKAFLKNIELFFLFEIHFQSSFIDLSFIQRLENFLRSDIIYEPLLLGVMSS